MAAKVYADASGNDHSEPLCLIAGFYNSVTNWSEFGSEWRDFLNRRGIQYLHQTNSKEKTNDEWKRDPANRASVLDEAVQIIQRSGAISLCFFTPAADYDGFIKHIESKDFKKPDCFAWNAFRFIVHVDGWCKDRRVKMPEFVFESSNRKEKNALRRVMADYGLAEPIFRTKLDDDPARTVVALQAADFVAYELFKGWKQIINADVASPPYILRNRSALPRGVFPHGALVGMGRRRKDDQPTACQRDPAAARGDCGGAERTRGFIGKMFTVMANCSVRWLPACQAAVSIQRSGRPCGLPPSSPLSAP